MLIEIFCLFQTSDFIPPTSDNRQQVTGTKNQEPRTKSKDCLVLIEIFCFFQTSDLRLPTSDLRQQTSDLRPPSSSFYSIAFPFIAVDIAVFISLSAKGRVNSFNSSILFKIRSLSPEPKAFLRDSIKF